MAQLSMSRFQSQHLGLRRVLLTGRRRVDRGRHTVTALLKQLPFGIGQISFRATYDCRFPASTKVPSRLLRCHPSVGTTRLRLLTDGSSMSTTQGTFFPSVIVKKGKNFGTFSLSG